MVRIGASNLHSYADIVLLLNKKIEQKQVVYQDLLPEDIKANRLFPLKFPPNATQLTPAQIEQIGRTVRRTPGAVVNVLPSASNDPKAVGRHLDYIVRNGELERR